MPGLSAPEKKARLARMTYAKYLTDVAGADPSVVKYFQTRPHAYFGVGIDAVSAQDAWGFGLPGFLGLDLGTEPGPGISHDSIQNEEAEKYWFHFPDGNASIARLLVRKLLPAAIPGNSVEDVVTARADYALLDRGQLHHPHPPEQHRGARAALGRRGQRQGSGSGLRQGRQVAIRPRGPLHPGVLALR